MNDTQLMNNSQRIIPWGTITCGLLAVITAVLVGLVHVGGVAVPFRTLGPGTIIGVGVLTLLAGLFVVLRSNAREHKARVTAPVPPLHDQVHDQPAAPSPLEQPSALGETLAALPRSPLDVTTADQQGATTEIPAAQGTTEIPAVRGAAEGPSQEGPGEAQSNH